MSSAASRPPQSVGQSVSISSEHPSSETKSADLRKPPSRPQLMGPPARPKPPAVVPEPEPVVEKAAPPPKPEVPQKIGPISPPSERMQYRAIGLIKGKYIASEEQFNRGNIAVEDGTLIDAVLLGRVTSLIKKHIDLETPHLWVVYPRTLYSEENVPALHVQIVGVWEPETLSDRNGDSKPAEEDSKYLSTAEATEQCDTFSVRGEIAKYTEDKNEIVVNIVQKSRSETTKPKRPFKLLINGQLEGRTTGYFWDLAVERKAGQLMLKESTQIAVVPPKKKAKGGARKHTNRRLAVGKPRTGGPVPKPVPKVKAAADKAKAENAPAEALPTEPASSVEVTAESAASSSV